MDLATLLGFIGGIIVIVVSLILGGNLAGFWDTASVIVVVGGSISATLINFPMSQFLIIGKILGKTFFAKEENATELIKHFIQLAVLVRKEGLLALEEQIAKVENPLMQVGLRLLADGVDADAVTGILNLQVSEIQQRHKVGQEVLKAVGRWAPAFGMIGTLIGLVQMLGNMSDPKSIGPSMAVAILTTFYGAVLSNLIALPLAAKLKQRSDQEVGTLTIIVEGIKGLQSGLNARIMEEKLKGFLNTSQQKTSLGEK